MRRALWLGLGGLMLGAGCYAPAEPPSEDWVEAACPYVGPEGECLLEAPPDPEGPRADFEARRTPKGSGDPRARRWARMYPELTALPELFGEQGALTAKEAVERELRAGRRPLPELLRPDRLIAAYAPELPPPQHHGASLSAYQVEAPWDKEVILVLIGLKAGTRAQAPLRKLKASVVWSWLAVDELRHTGDPAVAWRRQDATPWTAVSPRLEPSDARMSMFEVRPYPRSLKFPSLSEADLDPEAPEELDTTEPLAAVRVRFVDRYGIPSEMFGHIRAQPVAVREAPAAMQMAVATVAWARKLRGDPELKHLRWSRIAAMVPDEGVSQKRRDAIREMIQLSRKLR